MLVPTRSTKQILHFNSTWYLVSSFATTASRFKMSILPSVTGPAAGFRIQDFPVLASMRLGDEDLRILTQQGFLNREARRGTGYFKLRFRRGGKQCVKYV